MSRSFLACLAPVKRLYLPDPKRQLIGDDEHGWDDDGVFNFEGGCYAKTIKLSKQAEPEIFNAICRNALLENVVVDAQGQVDFDDGSKTENTRVSYPIFHIENKEIWCELPLDPTQSYIGEK